jgi:Pyruvate/2-oxoacid:ferredoxin oxidoreductase gamma subunit
MFGALAAVDGKRPFIEHELETEEEDQPKYYVDQNLNSWLYITLLFL